MSFLQVPFISIGFFFLFINYFYWFHFHFSQFFLLVSFSFFQFFFYFIFLSWIPFSSSYFHLLLQITTLHVVFFFFLLSPSFFSSNHPLPLPLIVFVVFLFTSHRLPLHGVFLFVGFGFSSSSLRELCFHCGFSLNLWIFAIFVFYPWVFVFLFVVGFCPFLRREFSSSSRRLCLSYPNLLLVLNKITRRHSYLGLIIFFFFLCLMEDIYFYLMFNWIKCE